ncbi:hypothetical protein HG531_007418 [Fusarium graminearum]|nr:hypothetical protein HG531_007418 [Fusarium graminearum]
MRHREPRRLFASGGSSGDVHPERWDAQGEGESHPHEPHPKQESHGGCHGKTRCAHPVHQEKHGDGFHLANQSPLEGKGEREVRVVPRLKVNYVKDVGQLTRVGNLNLDHSSTERFTIKGKGLLETIEGLKLDVTESLGALQLAVLNETDVDDTTACKEVGHGIVGNIVGKVTEVGGKGRLIGESLRGSFANGETCNCKLEQSLGRKQHIPRSCQLEEELMLLLYRARSEGGRA